MSYQDDYLAADKLRAEFTLWLKTSMLNARKMYFRTQTRKYEEIPYEELPMEFRIDPEDPYERIDRSDDAFYFEEERIAKAFFELPLMRREVLRLLFVCNLSPEQISRRLHCSASYVRKQKFYALKKLRELLEVADDE